MAQTTGPGPSPGPGSGADYTAAERGPHHTIWRRVTWETTPAGQRVSHVGQYTELATGLNYLQGGQYVPSSETIEVQPGHAVARHGQHQVTFPYDLAAGTIDLVTSEGRQVPSRVLGLSYLDSASTQSVWIAYAKTAIYAYNNLSLSHAQFAKCQTALALDSVTSGSLGNVLFCNVATNLSLSWHVSFSGENLTFANSACLIYVPNPGSGSRLLTVTDCIFANVTNLTYGTVTLSGAYNGFYGTPAFGVNNILSSSWPFQSAGGGDFHLANGSPFRGAGTVNIPADILASFAAKTTAPPLVCSNITFSSATNFSIQAPRNLGAPDLGYHYEPLDYVFDGVTANANLTFAPGTVAGGRPPTAGDDTWFAISLAPNITATFDGLVTQPVWWVRHNTVQECVNRVWDHGSRVGIGGFVSRFANTPAAAPSIQARFLRCCRGKWRSRLSAAAGTGRAGLVMLGLHDSHGQPLRCIPHAPTTTSTSSLIMPFWSPENIFIIYKNGFDSLVIIVHNGRTQIGINISVQTPTKN